MLVSPAVSAVSGARRRTVVYSPGEFLVSIFISAGLLMKNQNRQTQKKTDILGNISQIV